MKVKISKPVLLIFIVVGAGLSAHIAVSAITGAATVTALKKNTQPLLLIPRSYPDYHLERSRMLMAKIEVYKKRLDSLSKTDTAKYQEILKSNPELLANIQSIEALFNEQIKK